MRLLMRKVCAVLWFLFCLTETLAQALIAVSYRQFVCVLDVNSVCCAVWEQRYAVANRVQAQPAVRRQITNKNLRSGNPKRRRL